MSKENKSDSVAKTEIEELKEKTSIPAAVDSVKSKSSVNPYDAVIQTVDDAVVKRTKCYACIKESLPRAYISLGHHTVSAYSAKLVDTGTGWMELSAPTPGSFMDLTKDEEKEFRDAIKDRVVVWQDPQKQRCTIYTHSSKYKQPGHSIEPLAKYITFESSSDMTAEMVLSPEDIPTLYEKAEHELST